MPTVSVILPVYRSAATLGRSLEALRRQTFRDFEVIIMDSSPDQACDSIVARHFPEAKYSYSPKRLFADAAKNRAIAMATGELLVFMDPDAYPLEDWLEALVSSHSRFGGAMVGGVGCYGRKWIDLGAHFCKFDKWLPGGEPRRLKEGPTVNLMVPSELISQVGGFIKQQQHADTDLCWRLREQGVELWSVPQAIVEHHHLHTWRSLLQERYTRGHGYGRMELEWKPRSSPAIIWRLLVSVLPLRLLSQIWRVGKNAARAGMLTEYALALPLIATGLYAWLLGEASFLSRRILSRSLGRTA